MTSQLQQSQQIPILPKSIFVREQGGTGQTVLVIDEDAQFADAVKLRLESDGLFNVKIALDPFEGANLLADSRFDLVVTDFELQDWDAVTTLENADHLIDVDPTVTDQWQDLAPVKVLFCSGTPIRLNDLRRANKLNHFTVVGFLPKVTGLASICRSVERLTRGAG